MRKLIVAAGGLLLFSAGWGLGIEHTGTFGGSGWKALSLLERTYYLLGFEEGYRAGLWHGSAMAATNLAVHPLPPLTADEKRVTDEGTAEGRRVAAMFASPAAVKLSSLESTITTFYGDYRNMPVCWDKAVILSAASLAGKAATEQELAAARKKGAESGCR